MAIMIVPASLALADEGVVDPDDQIGQPWIDEPDKTVPGEEDEHGVAFDVPFLAEASAFLANIVDCTTGEPIDAAAVTTEYYFDEEATGPYSLSDLNRVVVWAEGYQPAEIVDLQIFPLNLFFVTINVITPREGDICLQPAGEPGQVLFDEDEEQPLPSPTPTPAESPGTSEPGECGAYEAERKVYRVAYHPAGATVARITKPNGGLETEFTFFFDRESFYKIRDRGPCTLAAGHTGSHSPWNWSAWREDGSDTSRVSFTKTVGGWPEGMSASYFERWILGACYQDLAARNLSHLRYVLGSFDAAAYYLAHIRPQLQ
jgi:hypothetical protein